MNIEKQMQDLQKLSVKITREKQDMEKIVSKIEELLNTKLQSFFKVYDDFSKQQKKIEDSIKDLQVTKDNGNINGVVIDYITFSQILNAICYGIRDEELYTKLIIMGKDQEAKQQKFTLEEVSPNDQKIETETETDTDTENEFDINKVKDLGFTEISNEEVNDIISNVVGNLLMNYIKNKR